MIKKLILNKYFYTGMAFLIWMSFFDQDNFVEQYRLSSQLSDLRMQKAWYLKEIDKNHENIKQLETDTTYLEKFAREKYFMKKDNEEIFVVVDEKE